MALTEAALAHWHKDMKLLMTFCLKYREVILEMQEEVEEFGFEKDDIVERYESLLADLATLEEERYTPLKNDPLDQYFAAYCNAAGYDLGIERVDDGLEGQYKIAGKKYQFQLK